MVKKGGNGVSALIGVIAILGALWVGSVIIKKRGRRSAPKNENIR